MKESKVTPQDLRDLASELDPEHWHSSYRDMLHEAASELVKLNLVRQVLNEYKLTP